MIIQPSLHPDTTVGNSENDDIGEIQNNGESSDVVIGARSYADVVKGNSKPAAVDR